MKLRDLLNELDLRGNEPFLSTPTHVPIDAKFFTDRGFELDFLERVNSGEEIDVDQFSYVQQNRIQNLIDRLMIQMIQGVPTITPEGKKFVEAFIDAKRSTITGMSTDQTSPSSGSSFGGWRF